MGLFDKIFGKKANEKAGMLSNYFNSMTEYTPVFTTFDGGLYEMELTRAAIHAFATACGKLKPEMQGAANRHLEKTLQFRPNPFMDTTKFIYRIATILSVCNNAFIVPIEQDGQLVGYYPILPMNAEVLDVGGVAYLRYTFANGQRAAIELDRVGIINQFQFKDDFFGSDNTALNPTMQMIHTQNQGIINGIKNAATIRFVGQLATALHDGDLIKERNRFTKENLSVDNDTGFILFDSKYKDFKQVDYKPFIVNSAQMKQIQDNVFNYFGVNEAILQNKYKEEEWNAFYQGKIEPFALQLSLVMTNMTFSRHEMSFGNKIMFTDNRLQYASNKTKLGMTSLFDRGLFSINEIREIWNKPPIEGGDEHYIRKEYATKDNLEKEEKDDAT
jgi:hypothetical protein